MRKRVPFIGLGLALGAGIGAAVHNIAVGVSFGFIIGLAIGSSREGRLHCLPPPDVASSRGAAR